MAVRIGDRPAAPRGHLSSEICLYAWSADETIFEHVQRWERETSLTERERRQLQDDGYFVLENVFTRDECDALNSHMLRKIEEAAEEYVSGARTQFVTNFGSSPRDFEVFWDFSQASPTGPASDWHRYVQRIGHGLHLVDQEFLRFVSAPAIACVLEQVIPAPVKIVLSVVIYKQPHQKVGFYPWHQDAVYVRTEPLTLVNTFIALDDMTKENGCLEVAPGSHRLGLDPHPHPPTHISVEDTSPGYQHRDFSPDEVVSLPIEQGSVIILPGTTYHKSEINRSSKPRRSLLFDSVSATAAVHSNSLIHEPSTGWLPIRAHR
jgi:phytanoyl-CoA hydroxylase